MTTIKTFVKSIPSVNSDDRPAQDVVQTTNSFRDTYVGDVRDVSRHADSSVRIGNAYFKSAPFPPNVYHRVKTSFELRSEKFSIDFDKSDVERIPQDQRTEQSYRMAVLRVMQRYHDLLTDVYEYWSYVIERRGPNPRKRRAYEDFDYQMVVKEIWQDSLKLLQDYEKSNNNDKDLRRQTIDRLYMDISFSELAWQSFFYGDLASEIGFERLK